MSTHSTTGRTAAAAAHDAPAPTSAPIRSIAPARRTLDQLADKLTHRADVFEHAHDPRCVFTRAYAGLTRRLADSLGNGGFEDPDWVASLSVALADPYLRALDQPGVNPGGSAWPAILDALEREDTSVEAAMTLGLTTLLVQDLPITLCKVGLYSAEGTSRIADYHALNDILGPAIEDISQVICARYAHRPLGGAQNDTVHMAILTNQGIRIARSTAWYNAQRLLESNLTRSTHAALRRWPRVVLGELRQPRRWPERVRAHGARLVSRLTRRWPD